MNSMLPAESAILAGFQSFRMILFLLRSIVVTLLALCTCQCNLHAHNFHLQFFNYAFVFFRHKKKTYSIASLIYHTVRPESIPFLQRDYILHDIPSPASRRSNFSFFIKIYKMYSRLFLLCINYPQSPVDFVDNVDNFLFYC